MDNHFHLLVETKKANLSEGMQWFLGTYAKRFNGRHKMKGHLFNGRFWSQIVQKETHYMAVVRYILLNPVRACMVKKPEQYRWSSLRGILNPKENFGIQTPPELLARFGDTPKEQKRGFLTFLYAGCDGFERLAESTRILGNQLFTEEIQELEGKLQKYRSLEDSDFEPLFHNKPYG